MTEHQDFAIGIDLGGTKILAGLVRDSTLIGEAVKFPTPKGPAQILDTLVEAIAHFQDEGKPVLGVGIATAGIVDPHSGAVLGSTGNLPGWEGTKVKHILEERTGLRVQVENDANAAAYGEFRAGDFINQTCVLMVTLGTGIGGGIIINGRLYRGSHYAGGEVGHLKVSLEQKRQCTCGLWDCWEEYGSGRGLVKTGKELLAGEAGSSSTVYARADALTTADIIDGASAGDELCRRAIRLYHEHITAGLSALCHTLDPNSIVVSGGMSKFVDMNLLRELLAKATLPRISERINIHKARLGEAAGMIGAAQLIIDMQTTVESMSVAG